MKVGFDNTIKYKNIKRLYFKSYVSTTIKLNFDKFFVETLCNFDSFCIPSSRWY